MPPLDQSAWLPGESFLDLAIAIALGLLVGLQRQRVSFRKAIPAAGAPPDEVATLAGVRTFAIVTALGALCAMLHVAIGAWLLGVGMIAIAALAIMGNVLDRTDRDIGLTTELSMLAMFVVGATVVLGHREIAIAAGVSIAIILHLKPSLHALARRVSDDDLRAILRFALITFIILPVLPDRTFGPYGVINPHRVWLMVVLVVGIGLAAYVAYRMLGNRGGTLVAGLLGGLISSTATTVSSARGVRQAPRANAPACAVILLATTMLYVRIIIEAAVVAPSQTRVMLPTLAVAAGSSAVVAIASLLPLRKAAGAAPAQNNPAELRGAILFALMYASVIFLVAAARDHIGPRGIYLVAALGGLTDMDAITLSSARLAERGMLEPHMALHAILIASIANIVFKIVLALTLGSRAFAVRVAIWLSPVLLASLALLIL